MVGIKANTYNFLLIANECINHKTNPIRHPATCQRFRINVGFSYEPELQGIRASDWKEGEKIKGAGDPPLKPETALATFKDGRYQNKSTGNHAVVFDRYGEKNGKKGMYVLEQARKLPAKESFIPFDDPSGKPIYQAEKYSVIRKP